jgi:antitoxin MazE
MKTTIQKWGNSLAVRIPKSFAEELRFADKGPAEMSLEDGAIILKPDRERAFDLESLLLEVTDENIHAAWGDGPVGGAEGAGAADGGGGGRSDRDDR